MRGASPPRRGLCHVERGDGHRCEAGAFHRVGDSESQSAAAAVSAAPPTMNEAFAPAAALCALLLDAS